MANAKNYVFILTIITLAVVTGIVVEAVLEMTFFSGKWQKLPVVLFRGISDIFM